MGMDEVIDLKILKKSIEALRISVIETQHHNLPLTFVSFFYDSPSFYLSFLPEEKILHFPKEREELRIGRAQDT